MDEKTIKTDLTAVSNTIMENDSEYVRLVSLISDTWEKAVLQYEKIDCHHDNRFSKNKLLKN